MMRKIVKDAYNMQSIVLHRILYKYKSQKLQTIISKYDVFVLAVTLSIPFL